NFNGQPFIEIQVNDNGPGLPPEILEHLYEPGHSTKGSGHGGLGLSIVRNLMQGLGGFISCRSSGQGTQFQLLVPRRLAAADEAPGNNYKKPWTLPLSSLTARLGLNGMWNDSSAGDK